MTTPAGAPHMPPPAGPAGPPMGPPPMGPPPMGPPGAAGPKAPQDPAKTAAFMLVGAAVLILIGVFSKSWVTGGGGSRSFSFGPMGAEMCHRSMCVEIPTDRMKLPGDVELVRYLALLGGFAAAAAAGAFGGLMLANKRDKLPAAKLANGAFGLAAFAMTFFVIRMMIEGKGVSISWAPFPGIGGVVLAGVGLRKLMPFLPPKGAPQLGAGGFAPGGFPPGGVPHGGPPAGYPQAGAPIGGPGGYPQGGMPPGGMPQGGMPPGGMPQGGMPQGGMPQGGMPQGGMPQGGMPQGGMPPGGMSQGGMAPGQGPAPQAAQPPQHACPRCGTTLQFVAEHQRWFCPKEQQYL